MICFEVLAVAAVLHVVQGAPKEEEGWWSRGRSRQGRRMKVEFVVVVKRMEKVRMRRRLLLLLLLVIEMVSAASRARRASQEEILLGKRMRRKRRKRRLLRLGMRLLLGSTAGDPSATTGCDAAFVVE